MDDGWIKLHRAALQSLVFQDDWLWRLFTWCLLKANHAEGNFKGHVVQRGSFITGKLRAAEELGVTESRWWRGVDRLSKPPYQCLHVSANNKWTTITVLNYETYQDSHAGNLALANNQRTTNEQPTQPIEEQQEPLSLPAWANLKLPDRYDTPEVWAWVPQWQAYWPTARNGDRLTPQVFLSQLQLAAQLGWDAPKLCRSFLKSVAVSARNLIDPDDGKSAPARGGANPKRESGPSYPTLGPRTRKDGGA